MYLYSHPVVRKRLIANTCPRLCPPEGIDGCADGFFQAEEGQVAAMFAGFDRDAHGSGEALKAYLPRVRSLRASADFRVWRDKFGHIVAMAAIARGAPRHARINAVFTDPAARGKGYAGAVVAALCEKVQAEGLTPMLYTDAENPSANRAYQKIGFLPVGELWGVREG